MSEQTLAGSDALQKERPVETQHRYLRFSVSDRLEHWVQVFSFTVLAITGLVQKFAENALSVGIISLLGGIESVRIIHRLAAIVLMLGVVYHIGAVGYKLFVLRVRPTILPTLNDISAAWQAILYNLGLRSVKPQQGRYTFDEKIEYWAFVWGTMVMVITGFMMWNPIATARFLPGAVIPAAKAAHGGEALLAVLAIIVWHVYFVHIRHFNKSMFTGYLSEEEMLEDHPIELADIKAGVAKRAFDPQQVGRRLRIFAPAYGVLAIILLFGIYIFVSFEETAITTIPPAEDVVVFAPLTPTLLPTPLPTKTPAPVAALTWEAHFAPLFQERCGACHSSTVALGGLDLSSYQTVSDGGTSGSAIILEDPDNSLLVVRLSTGDHPGQLSGEELSLVREWIQAGAPEQ